MDFCGISRIVSGGQTGVDRAALDFAVGMGLEHGGWCPKGRRAEDGRIPARYNLCENGSRSYAARTRRNIVDSDATLLFFRGRPRGGTLLTAKLCRELEKALFEVDLDALPDALARDFRAWVQSHGVRVLNVAGPRQEKGEYEDCFRVLRRMAAESNGQKNMDNLKVEC